MRRLLETALHKALLEARQSAPPREAQWIDALLSESETLPQGWHRVAWLLGGIRFIASDAGRHASAHLGYFAFGLALAATGGWFWLIDESDSTGYISALIYLAWIVPMVRPRTWWSWTLGLGAAVPLLAAISAAGGPFAFDRFDLAYSLVLIPLLGCGAGMSGAQAIRRGHKPWDCGLVRAVRR